MLNLYIFSLHTLLRHEIRYLWIRARYEQNMTGALSEVPRGSHDTRVYSPLILDVATVGSASEVRCSGGH